MSAFFDNCAAQPDGHRPPTSVKLTANLRTNVGSEGVLLVYRLDDGNGVFFVENGQRVKRIELRRSVSSAGTPVEVDVQLSVDPSQMKVVIIHGAVLSSDGSRTMNQCSSQIFIG
jgi:hypothetical protein